MDKKYLDKVVDQIVSETRIDYDQKIIHYPFLHDYFEHHTYLVTSLPLSPRFFSKHCRDIYGLNDDEVKYVWKEYREIVKDKLKNNG
jgi:hypothetical protein